MEIHEQRQAFIKKGENLVFDHTKLILRRGSEYFFARAKWRRRSAPSADEISQLETTKISIEDVWPPMKSSFTLAADPLPPNTYIKQPSLLHYGDSPASLQPGRHILAEIEACEVLRTLEVARHHTPDLPGFEVGGHEMFPDCIVL